MSSIQLYPYQLQHVERIEKILTTNTSFFAIDTSCLGSGKTPCACYLGKKFFKHVIVIAPKSTITQWEKWRDVGEVPIREILTYASLRGRKHQKVMNNGILLRNDYQEEIVQKKANTSIKFMERVEYTVSDAYQTYVNEGLLLIIDEFQNIKNNSLQQLACQTLIRAIEKEDLQVQIPLQQLSLDNAIENETAKNTSLQSKLLLLSGSPIDKQSQTITFFRTIGVYTKDKIASYNPYTRILQWHNDGMGQIVDYCHHLDQNTTKSIMFPTGKSSRVFGHLPSRLRTEQDLIPLIYDLFQKVVKIHVSSFAVVDLEESAKVTLERFNAFYRIEGPEDCTHLRNGVKALASSVSYDHKNDTVSYGANSVGVFGDITKALMQIERAKISTFARIVCDRYHQFQREKIVICLNYINNVDILKDSLQNSSIESLIMMGSTSTIHRGKILDRFLAHDESNLNQDRVLIGNMGILSTGIDLHDVIGTRRRFCLVSPNFRCLDLYQLSYRFLRQNTKSGSLVHIVYGAEEDCQEVKILNAIAKKGAILKDTTGEQNANMMFPNEYADWYEDETAKEKTQIHNSKGRRVLPF